MWQMIKKRFNALPDKEDKKETIKKTKYRGSWKTD